ncbi:MAG: DUF4184 family protein [Candidatus Bathyarchaeia archaeon]|nr:DUF4184 family protein [Candidatus Bathyarchaeota archaeon]
MPSAILSHQAVVIPFKAKWPEKFDGTSLCVGSFVPDLQWFFSPLIANLPSRTFHSLGDLVYLVPLSLALIVILDRVVFPATAYLAGNNRLGPVSQCLAYFGVDEWSLQKRKKLTPKWLVVATYSIVLGVLTHFLLDLPTHRRITYLLPFFEAEMPAWFLVEYTTLNLPFFGTWEVTHYNQLWLIFTVALGPLTLLELRYIKNHGLMAKWNQTQTT